ncbi:hypothetical protein [Providencia burhodogranariea]|uniref:Uncharacterized protein n=1 Tax=Providencia burhodogranariea DSM 19968 TaxID=1141662 RepID=K8WN06_9GAMM|nr:hypothetical protein [Providencia burhodogranariea]EKT61993.1 hypothetical protein OOA_08881 [Providencia burhodogranariea DSM 19968]
MFKVFSLIAPYLPQMRDGVINNDDLSVDNKIYVEVAKYELAAIGDEILVNFGSISSKLKVITDPTSDFPIQIDFDARIIPDGIYMVNYSATDFAGNANESPIVTAVVDRLDSGKLIPPIFSDADANNIITNQNVIINMGTHILVPAYDNIMLDDSVSVTFWILDPTTNQIVPGSSYTVNHTIIQEDIFTGFTILVPETNILLVKRGLAKARYYVTSANNPIATSQIATATLELDGSITLPGPIFIDNINGWLTTEQLIRGIRESCGYDDIQNGDTVTLYISGYKMDNTPVEGTSTSLTTTVTPVDVNNGFTLFSFLRTIAEKVYFGYLTSYYKVTRGNNIRYSYYNNVKVDLKHISPLPAPIFTQAKDDVIYLSDIENNNGASIRIYYPKMAIDDNVTIYTDCTDINGEFIENSAYQDITILTQIDIMQGYYDFLCPKEKVLLAPVGGQIHASYRVRYANDEGFSYSEMADVFLESDTGGSMNVIITTNAAPYDYNIVHVYPCNYAKIFGPAGAQLSLSTSNDVVFVESGSSTHSLILNEKGEGRFRVRSARSGSALINIFQINDPSKELTIATSFGKYILGEGSIDFYNYSTNAASDGVMPCCIYLKTDAISGFTKADITKVRVAVDGDAKIVGYDSTYSQSATINLNDDHSCEITIINTTKELVTATITLPESSGTILRLELSFQ